MAGERLREMAGIIEKDKITVVVAIYNIEKYISRCIKSIVVQTYDNLQIVLVDDGSSDSSGRICDEYEKKDSRVEVIHQKNQGLSEARNTGIRTAQGKWIAFIDGDDYIHPQFIERLYDAEKVSGSEIAICAYKMVKGDEEFKTPFKRRDRSIELSSSQMLENWHGKMTRVETVAWNKLYDLELFRGIQYPRGRLHEDVYTTHLLIARAKKIIFIREELYMYFQREDSIIRNKLTENRIRQSLEAQEKRIQFFDKKVYPKAHRNLKKGLIKHAVYYYWKVLTEKQSAGVARKQLMQHIIGQLVQYVKY